PSGCGTPTGSAGHAGATANLKLPSTWTTQRVISPRCVVQVEGLRFAAHPSWASIYLFACATESVSMPAPSVLDDTGEVRTLRRPSKQLARTCSLCHQN